MIAEQVCSSRQSVTLSVQEVGSSTLRVQEVSSSQLSVQEVGNSTASDIVEHKTTAQLQELGDAWFALAKHTEQGAHLQPIWIPGRIPLLAGIQHEGLNP